MLSLKKETGSGRKGIYSTGLLSKFEEKQIALFNTGKKHAGENLEKLLSQRAKDRSPPIQMSDDLSRNVPKEVKTILTNCNVHARRKFVEIFDAYPDGILLPVNVMYHGTAAHTLDKTACTAYPSVRGPSRAPMPAGAISFGQRVTLRVRTSVWDRVVEDRAGRSNSRLSDLSAEIRRGRSDRDS